MAAKAVATVGDVTAEVGKTMYGKAVKGDWTAGTIEQTSYGKLKIGGKKVLHEAKCKFSFSGTGPSPDYETVTGTDTVTLTAKTTKLQKGASNVLVDGDTSDPSKPIDYGNKLKVGTQNVLKSA